MVIISKIMRGCDCTVARYCVVTYRTGTAVCVDHAKCEPKSCAHEYNCVVRLPIQTL